MKKTILTLALFITTLTLTFAQEKQGDATWEETIDFIKSKKKFISIDDSTSPSNEIKIDGQGIQLIIYTWSNYPKGWEKRIYYMPFRYLKSVKPFKEGSYCYIDINKLSGEYVSVKVFKTKKDDVFEFNPKGSKYYLHGSYNLARFDKLCVNDVEMRERLTKAFQHLTYLAIQKREAERKASGDKF